MTESEIKSPTEAEAAKTEMLNLLTNPSVKATLKRICMYIHDNVYSVGLEGGDEKAASERIAGRRDAKAEFKKDEAITTMRTKLDFLFRQFDMKSVSEENPSSKEVLKIFIDALKSAGPNAKDALEEILKTAGNYGLFTEGNEAPFIEELHLNMGEGKESKKDIEKSFSQVSNLNTLLLRISSGLVQSPENKDLLNLREKVTAKILNAFAEALNAAGGNPKEAYEKVLNLVIFYGDKEVLDIVSAMKDLLVLRSQKSEKRPYDDLSLADLNAIVKVILTKIDGKAE